MFEHKDASNQHDLMPKPTQRHTDNPVVTRARHLQTEWTYIGTSNLDIFVDEISRLEQRIADLNKQLRDLRGLYQRDFNCDL